MNIKPNTPHELVDNEALFSIHKKAEAIKTFITNYYGSNELPENRIIALYGEWGSGKTSVVKHLEKELEKATFKTIYFPVWEYETDSDVNLSLFDAIAGKISEKGNHSDVIVSFLQTGYSITKGFAKSLKIKTGVFEWNPLEILEEYEKYYKSKYAEKSFFLKQKEEFKNRYIELEKAVLDADIDEKIIVFIDDLDRCEPENILNLISLIKHFMTLGEKTIFFFSLDKKAVSEAVKVRYAKHVNANEYLEKIFDISFTMPTFTEKTNILKEYFPEYSREPGVVERIIEFLNSIKFGIPRHLKKVLNKYEFTKHLRNSEDVVYRAIPAGMNNLLFDVLWLYLIILHDFYHNKFIEIEDYIAKTTRYRDALNNMLGEKLSTVELRKEVDGMMENYMFVHQYNLTYSELKIEIKKRMEKDSQFKDLRNLSLLSYFSPDADYFIHKSFGFKRNDDFIGAFKYSGNEILLDFCKFLNENEDLMENESDLRIIDLFNTAKLVL